MVKQTSDKDYRKKLSAFRISCKVYSKEKEELVELEAKYPELLDIDTNSDAIQLDQLCSTGFGNAELYRLLRQDIGHVDEVFFKLDKTCGHTAYMMLRLIFIEGKTQSNVASAFGLSRRQMQYSMDKWMKQVL